MASLGDIETDGSCGVFWGNLGLVPSASMHSMLVVMFNVLCLGLKAPVYLQTLKTPLASVSAATPPPH